MPGFISNLHFFCRLRGLRLTNRAGRARKPRRSPGKVFSPAL